MPYTHILVAVDLSEQCHAVMQRAMALAQCSQARLSLVHVIEPLAMAFAADVPMDLSLLQQQQTEQAMQRFRQFAAQYSALRDEDRHLLAVSRGMKSTASPNSCVATLSSLAATDAMAWLYCWVPRLTNYYTAPGWMYWPSTWPTDSPGTGVSQPEPAIQQRHRHSSPSDGSSAAGFPANRSCLTPWRRTTGTP